MAHTKKTIKIGRGDNRIWREREKLRETKIGP